jgi:branched-subunit amino acid aminotransferase/4-amino-4-deoxychorismate lyase
MLATRLAKRDGADEALWARPDGTLLEAPTSTVFWADSEGNLHTPALETGVLASITRQRIMDLAPVRESAEYRLSDIEDAKEVFIASSLREVQGVSVVDGLEFDCPGPVTQRVAGLLSERIEAELGRAGTVA